MEEKRLIQPPFFRRCCSTPEFTSLGGADETENSHLKVYVVARPFQEYGGALVQRLPEDFKELALQIGVCHFMTVFKTNGGDLYQFDFGPQGGRDIQTNGGPLSCILEGETKSSGRKEKHHPGEIREQKLMTLPSANMYIGQSNLRIEDIRNFNVVQCLDYELHKNDCRHYVNNVVQYTTGVHNASAQLVRHTFGNQERNMPHFSLLLVRLLQCITDASNWSKVKATGNAVVASMVYLAGSTAATRVRAVVAGQSYAPGFQHPVRRAAVAAVASAAASCPQASMARRVADFGAMVGDRANRVKTGAVSTIEAAGKTVFHAANACRSRLPDLQQSRFHGISIIRRYQAGFFPRSVKKGGNNSPPGITQIALPMARASSQQASTDAATNSAMN